MNTEKELYQTDDGIKDYTNETKKSLAESLAQVIGEVVGESIEIVKDVVTSVVNQTVNIGRAIISTASNICRSVASWFGF